MVQIKRRQLLQRVAGTLLGAALPRAVLAQAMPQTLVAAYFGGWSVTIDKSQQGVHGDNPWAVYPNRQFPYVQHKMGLYPERFPIIGPAPGGYDDRQQWVIDSEILTASTLGIDVFAMNWYRDEFLNHPVVNFKASPNKGMMKWFLQWSNNANVSASPPRDSREYFFEGIRRAAVHMRDPSYWQQNGKPVFAIYSVAQIDRIINATLGRAAGMPYRNITEATQLHDAFLQDCHRIVANVLAGDETGGISGKLNATVVRNDSHVPAQVNTRGIVQAFVPSMHLVVATGDVGSWAQCATVQGMYVYNVRSGNFNGVKRLAHSFTELMTACQQNYELIIPAMQNFAPGKTWWPTLMAGWDQRAWGGTSGDPLADQCLPTTAEFEAHCMQVRSVQDNYPMVTNGITFIYAWNEFGEGGWIAPTRDLGAARLYALHDKLKI